MKVIFSLTRVLAIACVGYVALASSLVRAQEATTATANPAATTESEAADKAWRAVRKATQSPMPPAEWQTNKPGKAEINKFYIPLLVKGADAAKDFYTRYPNHTNAVDAHRTEYGMLMIASERFDDTAHAARIKALETAIANNPKTTEDEKFGFRAREAQSLLKKLPESLPEFIKAADMLHKDFPKRTEVYQLMLMAVMQTEGAQAKELATKIMDSDAPEDIKERMKGILKREEAVGKPVAISFTAVDGREVDIAKMKGKVVLVDFWATWCGPCMAELPNVKAAYEKLHDKGFEIVGISFDQDKDALQKTLKQKEMTWPQFYDGEGWKNKYSIEFGINSIPSMWLVDKKGNLRDANARGELEEKVSKLLAE